jgi:hypothetical protein
MGMAPGADFFQPFIRLAWALIVGGKPNPDIPEPKRPGQLIARAGFFAISDEPTAHII